VRCWVGAVSPGGASVLGLLAEVQCYTVFISRLCIPAYNQS